MELYSKIDHNVLMCILQGECCSSIWEGVMALGLFLHDNNVFTTFANSLRDLNENWYKERFVND
jgi:hypothetical protein